MTTRPVAKHRDCGAPAHHRPTIVGIGLIAQDVVVREGKALRRAGGSCGNVLAFSQWLGWRSIPIGRLGDDLPGVSVRTELESLGVDWTHVSHEPRVGTPVIIQEFVPAPGGVPVHRFRFACPTCKGWLPRFTPPTIKKTRQAWQELVEKPEVLFFDRACPAAIDTAAQVRLSGGLVFFEPAGLGDPRLFERAAKCCDVLKYSHEHREKFSMHLGRSAARVEIETLGADGLHFRTSESRKKSPWRHVPAYGVHSFRDAAGAGDACSAGIIRSLEASRHRSGWSFSAASLLRAVKFGQALAALNCNYIGARGLMHAVKAKDAVSMAEQLVAGKDTIPAQAPNWSREANNSAPSCAACDP